MARRCEDIVDKKRVRVEQPKISPKNPGNALSDALLISRFQKFVADAAKKKPRSARFFETALRVVSINELIRINLGPKILRSCFLHWGKGQTKKVANTQLNHF